MTNKMKLLSMSVATAALITGSIAFAETVTTKTTTYKTIPAEPIVQLETFDLNNDGVFNMKEIGEKLFYHYDTDGNEVIDNIEWDQNAIITLNPVDSIKVRMVDTDDDGMNEIKTTSYTRFYETTGLVRFDDDQDGLSAEEFINQGFYKLDTDDDKLVSLEEWQAAYLGSVAKHNRESNYNG